MSNIKYLLKNACVLTGFAKMDNCAITIDENGTIDDVFEMRRLHKKELSEDTIIIDVQGAYISPGFIDTHIHGIGGFGTEDCSPNSILGMSERLADFGITSFLPTIYTCSPEKMKKAITAIVEAMGKEKGARIEGINLEGPFISPNKVGAQDPDGVQPVSITLWRELFEAGKGHIKCMTVAPELKKMRTLALEAQKNGVVLSAGHTDAQYEHMIEGMQCGILHSTHCFNAMRPLHHRNPGAVGAILIHEDMKTEIICDGIHVHPELVKLLIRDKPISNILMVTDSLRPTMQTEGKLTANGVEAELKDNAWVSKEDNDLFLGSSLTLLKAAENMDSWDIDLDQVIQMSSSNPARVYKLEKKGIIVPGNIADIAVFDKDFNLKATFIGGEKIRDNF